MFLLSILPSFILSLHVFLGQEIQALIARNWSGFPDYLLLLFSFDHKQFSMLTSDKAVCDLRDQPNHDSSIVMVEDRQKHCSYCKKTRFWLMQMTFVSWSTTDLAQLIPLSLQVRLIQLSYSLTACDCGNISHLQAFSDA